MPRPKLRRRIRGKPNATYFKPQGVPIRDLEELTLEHEEFEALRLIEVQSLSQTEAAQKMNISQSTLSRILTSARKKVARGIVEGKAMRIEQS